MAINKTTLKSLLAQRAKALAAPTTTEAEYRAKWARVNELTHQIALANGATADELAAYGKAHGAGKCAS